MDNPMPLAPIKATAAVSSRMPGVTIDREALAANWKTLAARQPGARTGAAVKANGYGLGASGVARTLYDAGCRDFFVAWAEEGAAVRDALQRHALKREDQKPERARIFVLQGLEPASVALHLEHGLTPVLSTFDDIVIWREGLLKAGKNMPAALQVESGMNRLGMDRNEAIEAASLFHAGDLELSLVMSHLASADEPGSQSAEQHGRFLSLAALFPGVPRSLANSAGVFRGREFGFDLTRPGIALYGGEAGEASRGALKPVATLTAAVLQVRMSETGEAAGYGAAAKLTRPTRIATIGLGYADGYPRAASGAGVDTRQVRPGANAFITGHTVPVLGRISMDLTLLDITDLPENAVKPGDRAEFFGPNIAINDVALAAGTIAYELLTGLGPRVARDWG